MPFFFFLQYLFSELYSSQVLFKIIYWVVSFYFSMGRRTEVRDGFNKDFFHGS